MISTKFCLYVLLFFSIFQTSVDAAVIRAPKQMFILRPSNNQVWGNYIFSAESTEEKGEKANFELLLPKETADFRAVQGLTPDNIELKDGSLFFSKFIPSRLELYGIDFLLEASFGKAKVTIELPYDTPEVSILLPQKSNATVVDASKKMEEADSLFIGDGSFKVYRFKGNKKGESISFVLQGISQGRAVLWIVGWVFIGLLTVAALILSLLNRKA